MQVWSASSRQATHKEHEHNIVSETHTSGNWRRFRGFLLLPFFSFFIHNNAAFTSQGSSKSFVCGWKNIKTFDAARRSRVIIDFIFLFTNNIMRRSEIIFSFMSNFYVSACDNNSAFFMLPSTLNFAYFKPLFSNLKLQSWKQAKVFHFYFSFGLAKFNVLNSMLKLLSLFNILDITCIVLWRKLAEVEKHIEHKIIRESLMLGEGVWIVCATNKVLYENPPRLSPFPQLKQ